MTVPVSLTTSDLWLPAARSRSPHPCGCRRPAAGRSGGVPPPGSFVGTTPLSRPILGAPADRHDELCAVWTGVEYPTPNFQVNFNPQLSNLKRDEGSQYCPGVWIGNTGELENSRSTGRLQQPIQANRCSGWVWKLRFGDCGLFGNWGLGI